MLKYGNKEFRNLEEQVQANKDNIEDMARGVTVLAEFGIKVVGHVADAEDLPDPETYEGDYGDAYTVGEEGEPNEFYIFTRAFEGQTVPQWYNIGVFPKPGPQGIQGIQGPQGVAGPTALEYKKSIIGTSTPTQVSLTASDFNRTPVVGDSFYMPVYNSSSGDTYFTVFSVTSVTGAVVVCNPIAYQSIKGPQGIQGIQGIQGLQGDTGPQGPQGPRGDVGGFVHIVDTLTSESQLPDPEDLHDLTKAYLVGDSRNLYIQVGEDSASAEWVNTGPLNAATLVYAGGEYQNVWDSDVKANLAGGNTFTGTSNTFNTSIRLYHPDIANKYGFIDTPDWGGLYFGYNNTRIFGLYGNDIAISMDNQTDLGSSAHSLKDVYLKGNINLGNTVTLSSNTYNGLDVKINGSSKYTLYNGYGFVQSLYPGANNAYDLGSTSYKWKDLYLAGKAYLPTIYPDASDRYTYINKSAGSLFFTSISGSVKTNCHFTPSISPNTLNLGSTSAKWATTYTNKIAGSDNLTVNVGRVELTFHYEDDTSETYEFVGKKVA